MDVQAVLCYRGYFCKVNELLWMCLHLIGLTVLCFLGNILDFGSCALPGQRYAEEVV